MLDYLIYGELLSLHSFTPRSSRRNRYYIYTYIDSHVICLWNPFFYRYITTEPSFLSYLSVTRTVDLGPLLWGFFLSSRSIRFGFLMEYNTFTPT